MSSWFGRWFAYGLGAKAGQFIFGDGDRDGHPATSQPVREQTEAEIREAERRYDDEAKRYEAEDKAARPTRKRGFLSRFLGRTPPPKS